MKGIILGMFAFFAGASMVAAESDTTPVNNTSVSTNLWASMYAAGMLSDAEYQFALQYNVISPQTAPLTNSTDQVATSSGEGRFLKQLTTAARRAEAFERLTGFSTRMHKKYATKRRMARIRARAFGLPLREELPSGGVAEWWCC